MPTSHLLAAGQYILEKQPTTVVHLGDIGDFEALSSYDSAAHKALKEVDVTEDIRTANEVAEMLTRPVRQWNKSHRRSKQIKIDWTLLEGNHDAQTGEGRVARLCRDQPWFRGVFNDLDYAQYGWRTIPFLQPEIIDGIAYAHFFCRNAKGAVMQSRNGQTTAANQVMREGISATAGHKQGLDTHIQQVGGGKRRRGIIAGSFYQHDESYKSPQGNHHWRGILVKHEVRDDGDYDLVEVSMQYLLRKYV